MCIDFLKTFRIKLELQRVYRKRAKHQLIRVTFLGLVECWCWNCVVNQRCAANLFYYFIIFTVIVSFCASLATKTHYFQTLKQLQRWSESLIQVLPAWERSESSDKSLTYGSSPPTLFFIFSLMLATYVAETWSALFVIAMWEGKTECGVWRAGRRSLGASPRSLAIKYPWRGGRGEGGGTCRLLLRTSIRAAPSGFCIAPVISFPHICHTRTHRRRHRRVCAAPNLWRLERQGGTRMRKNKLQCNLKNKIDR